MKIDNEKKKKTDITEQGHYKSNSVKFSCTKDSTMKWEKEIVHISGTKCSERKGDTISCAPPCVCQSVGNRSFC